MKQAVIILPLLLFFLAPACTPVQTPALPTPLASAPADSMRDIPDTPAPPTVANPAPEPLRVVQGHPAGTYVLISWSADGNLLASSGYGEPVIVWDMQTLEPVHTLTHPEMDYAGFTRFSPDGHWLMVAEGWQGEIDYQVFEDVGIWDLETGARLERATDRANVYEAAWSPAGHVLAYLTSASNAVQYWAAPGWEAVVPESSPPPSTKIHKIRWLADGTLVALTTADDEPGRIFIWRSTTPKTMIPLHGPYVDFSATAISPDGSWAAALVSVPASATVNGVDLGLFVWDAATGDIRHTFPGHDVYGVKELAISPDNALLAIAKASVNVTPDAISEVRIWDLASGGLSAALPGDLAEITSLAFSPDGQALAAGELNGEIRLWQLDAYLHSPITPTPIPSPTPVPAASARPVFLTSLTAPGVDAEEPGHLNSLRWLDQNNLYLIALSHYADPITWQTTWQQRITRYDLLNGEVIGSELGPEEFREGLARQPQAYSPDGASFAYWLSTIIAPGQGAEESVEVLDTATNKPLFQIPAGQIGRGNDFAWSPDGSRLAVQTFEAIELFAVPTGTHLMTLENVIEPGEKAEYSTVIWSSDGKWIASHLQGEQARFRVIIWDAETGTIFRLYEQEPNPKEGRTSVDHIAFSPDSGRLLLVKGDAAVLDILTGELQGLPAGTAFSQFAGTGAWSADGVYVAVDYREVYLHTASVLIWNTETSDVFIPFRRATESYSNANLVWAPGRPWLATIDEGMVYIFDAAEGAIIRLEPAVTLRPEKLVWSPDGSKLAIGSGDRTVEIWTFSE